MSSVQEVRSFKTSDGKLHKDLASANKCQAELNFVGDMKKLIGEAPNSSGYIQLTDKTHREFLSLYETAIRNCMSGETYQTFIKGGPRGFVGRILSDSDTPLYAFYCAATSIDSQLRYWEQPYFANNTGSAPLVCLGER